MAKRTLYEIAGVVPGAASEDIAKACDLRRSEIEAQGSQDASTLALVRHARDVLTDPERRAAYDASLAAPPAAAASAPNPVRLEGRAAMDAEEGDTPHRAPPWGLVAVGGAALFIVALFVARMMTNPVPPPPAPEPVAPKAAAPAPPAVLTPAQVLSRVSPSIARLQTVDLAGNVLPLGMAVATGAGLAITTCHAIPANAQIVMTFGAERAAGTLVITDEVLDLCRLSIAGAAPPALAFSSEEARVGDKVYVVSPDAPGSYALAEATVRQLSKTPEGETFQVSTKAANGAPVVDTHGLLLGIASGDNVVPAAYIEQARSRTR